MSNINYDWLSSSYINLADDFINKINKTNMTLFFVNDLEVNNNPSEPLEFSLDSLGGKGVSSDLDGRRSEENLSQGIESVTGIDITVRAYWKEKDDEPDAKSLGIKDAQSICKVISFTTHVPTIKNAEYAVIDGYKIKMVRPPLPHGLFGDKRYSTSYWEIID